MKNFKIFDIKKFNEYVLEDEHGEKTNCVFEFYGKNVEKGDIILISEKLLDKKGKFYSEPLAFQVININTFEQINKKELIEYIAIENGKDITFLKRIYG